LGTRYKASIVLPAYNEEQAIGATLEGIRKSGLMNTCEVITVDDASTDRTPEIVAEFEGVRLISHHTNKGYGAALKTGIRASQAPKVVVMDSDGQHSSECVEEVIHLLDQYPMVIGERTSDSFQVKTRLVGKKLIRIIGEYLVEQKLPDYNSGFRGFRRSIISGILHMMPNGFSFSTTSTLAFIKMGYDIGVIPIRVAERVGRPSNVNVVKDGLKTLLLICRIIMLFNPLKIFVPSAGMVLLVGMLWTVYGFFVYSRIPNSSIAVLMLGFLLFFIGLVADQISMLNLKERDSFDARETGDCCERVDRQGC